jgi:hypothetical protein
MNAGNNSSRATQRRGAALYLTVFGTATIIAVVTISALTTAHLRTKGTIAAENLAEAGILAMSAMEHGLAALQAATMDGDPTWRWNLVSGEKVYLPSFGKGAASWMLVDEDDGYLEDNSADPVRLYGMGQVGESIRVRSVLLQATGEGLELLQTTLHAADEILIKATKSLKSTGAPLSTNGNLRNEGTIYGDVEALTQSGSGGISGTIEIPAPPKQMPDPSVIDLYRGIATPIEYPGAITRQVLSPKLNPWGVTNPDGVYSIDTRGNDLLIQGSRIYGTLVVQAIGMKVVINDAAFLHPYRRDYPVLIVNGNLEIRLNSDLYGLDEAAWSTNFNPPAAAYIDEPDDDQSDVYPNEIRGLVHVTGELRFFETPKIKGVVICESTVLNEDSCRLEYDPALASNPPMGYTAGGMVVPVRGTWRWDTLP